MNGDTSHLNIRNIPSDLHRAAKAQAAREGRTLRELVIAALEAHLEPEAAA